MDFIIARYASWQFGILPVAMLTALACLISLGWDATLLFAWPHRTAKIEEHAMACCYDNKPYSAFRLAYATPDGETLRLWTRDSNGSAPWTVGGTVEIALNPWLPSDFYALPDSGWWQFQAVMLAICALAAIPFGPE